MGDEKYQAYAVMVRQLKFFEDIAVKIWRALKQQEYIKFGKKCFSKLSHQLVKSSTLPFTEVPRKFGLYRKHFASSNLFQGKNSDMNKFSVKEESTHIYMHGQSGTNNYVNHLFLHLTMQHWMWKWFFKVQAIYANISVILKLPFKEFLLFMILHTVFLVLSITP